MIEHIEAVQRMQDYIAKNLADTITLADLAVQTVTKDHFSVSLAATQKIMLKILFQFISLFLTG